LFNKNGIKFRIVYYQGSLWPSFSQLRDLPLKEQLLQVKPPVYMSLEKMLT